jgi:two-component system OmpR family response regulator
VFVRLFIVEDHPDLGPDLKIGLEGCHFAVNLIAQREDALALANSCE